MFSRVGEQSSILHLKPQKAMDLDLHFIPPCCVDKKLPSAIMHAPSRTYTFYTHGDVTMEKFYRAVSYLVADPHVMVLAINNITSQTADFLYQCFSREWITHLILSTRTDAEQLVNTRLQPYRNRILYAKSNEIADCSSHLVLYSGNQSLSLSGPMLTEPSKQTLMTYTVTFQPRYTKSINDCDNPLLNILLPDILRMRKKHKTENVSLTLTHFLDLQLPPYED